MNKFFKLILLSIFLYLLLNSFCYAAQSISIDNTSYIFKYSNCSAKSKSCLNEYYKKNEQGMNWTSLFTVVYTKIWNDPISFAQRLSSSQKYSDIIVNKKENCAIVHFNIPYKDDKGQIYIEQNIAKITKYSSGMGSISQQYAIRFKAPDKKEELITILKNNFTKYVKILDNIPEQKVYLKSYQAW